MLQMPCFYRDNERPSGLGPHACLVATLIACVVYLIHAGSASAAEATRQMVVQPFSAAKIFMVLFVTLGPIKIIAPFSKITMGADVRLTRQIALRATLYSSLALLFAGIFGERTLLNYGVPLPILSMTGGIILFLVALLNILHQFTPTASHSENVKTPTPTLDMALTPLAFPMIVTPYGIAVFVAALGLSPDLPNRLMICAILLAIMLMNLVVMLSARRSPPFVGIGLTILGSVLGVIQAALGLQFIFGSLKALGVL